MTASKRSTTPPITSVPISRDGNEAVVTIVGPLARADIAGLCDRVEQLLEMGGDDEVVCDVRDLGCPTGESVDALARVRLLVGRAGRRMRLANASQELRDLLSLSGLSEIFRSGD